MAKKVNIIFISMVLIIILFGSPVSGWIVEHHITQDNQAIDQTRNSPTTQEIIKYIDFYHLGNILTDISVVDYFAIEEEEGDTFIDRFFKIFTFNIGSQYRATHSAQACIRALEVARDNQKLRAIAWGLCSHLTQDAVSHNDGVPGAIHKTHLWNGLIHSPKEIHDKNLMSNHADRVYSRQILELAKDPEVVQFFEEVFVQDPVFSRVDIPKLIDFFRVQVQSDTSFGGYQLGFRSFFALPTYVYWFILISFLLFLTLLGLTLRKIRNGERNIATIFVSIISFGFIIIIGLAIYGLLSANVWSIWERLSQFIFSPAMYPVGIGLLVVSLVVFWQFITKPNKIENIPNLLVSIFLIIIAVIFFIAPNALTIGNEKALHDKSVYQTSQMLTLGANYVKTIADPVGFSALRDADASGAGIRAIVMWTLIILFLILIYYTFRRRRKI